MACVVIEKGGKGVMAPLYRLSIVWFSKPAGRMKLEWEGCGVTAGLRLSPRMRRRGPQSGPKAPSAILVSCQPCNDNSESGSRKTAFLSPSTSSPVAMNHPSTKFSIANRHALILNPVTGLGWCQHHICICGRLPSPLVSPSLRNISFLIPSHSLVVSPMLLLWAGRHSK